jgi:hypothetical protein
MTAILQESPYHRIFFRIKQQILEFLTDEQKDDKTLQPAMCAVVATLSEFLCTTSRELGIDKDGLVKVIEKTWEMTKKSDEDLKEMMKVRN